MIQLRNITLDLGAHHIFENITCVLGKSDRIGVIGRNGAGKSTLLKVIAGLIKPTSGEVAIEKGARIAYLPQEEVLASSLTVFDEAFSAFGPLMQAQQRIDEIEEKITHETCTTEDLEEYAHLQEQVRGLNKHDAIKQTYDVLTGLGFTETTITGMVNALSTGWKMRLALAKLLLTDADMYLFDEPTNHLDVVTQQWFLNKLRSMRQGFLLVSHDRIYLEKACNCILEIERGRGTFYRGNLQSYLNEKEKQIEIARTARARQDREIAQKQAVAERFRASASRAKQAQNIFRQIDRMELIEVEPPLPVVNFHFPEPQRPGLVVLAWHNLSFGFGDTPLFTKLSGEIQRGERVALLAANGVGKTTLINCLIGKYKPTNGTITIGHNVSIAFFEQDQARALGPNKTILQEVCENCSRSSEAEIRATLGAFQFSGDDVHKKIKVLSGGEKNRVAMTKVLLQRANFLVLDEPTNHLDLYAKDVLRQALSSYQGTILFVSHDLDFLARLATRIIELTPTSAHSYPGTYEEFCAFKQLQAAAMAKQISHKDSAPTLKKESAVREPQSGFLDTKAREQNSTHVSQPLSQGEIQALRKRTAQLERTIARLEQEEAIQAETLATHTYGSSEYSIALVNLKNAQDKLAEAHNEWEAVLRDLENT